MLLTVSPLRSTAKLPRLSCTSLAVTLLGLQSAHAPAARVIYKPLTYRFNMGLFIIIKRLKASTLAWPPKEHGCGWMECCSLSRQCSHLNPLCHPSAQTHLTRPPLKARLGLLKPESLVQRNNMEDTSEGISLSHATKANLRWIQTLSKYLHLFFPPSLQQHI